MMRLRKETLEVTVILRLKQRKRCDQTHLNIIISSTYIALHQVVPLCLIPFILSVGFTIGWKASNLDLVMK